MGGAGIVPAPFRAGWRMPRTWVKIHIEFLDNPKVMTLSLSLRGVWLTALAVAERYDRDGLLPPADRFALMAHTDDETAEKAFAALARKGLLDETSEGFRIHDWGDWQARRPSEEPEAVAARQAKWYANKKARDLTTPNALGNVEQHPNEPNDYARAPSESKSKSKSEKERKRGQPTVATPPQAAHRAMFAALASAFGDPSPGPEKGRYEAAARDLVAAGTDPSEVPRLCEAWGWVNPGPPRVNSLAGQLTVLRNARPRASPNGGSNGRIAQNLGNLAAMEGGGGYEDIFAGDGRAGAELPAGAVAGTRRTLPPGAGRP